MAHAISGIITSFKYDGDRPNIVLIGDYHIIPVDRQLVIGNIEAALPPYQDFTFEVRKLIRQLSIEGPCAYVETDFHGGDGEQRAEVWQDGKRTQGPLVSIFAFTDEYYYEVEKLYAGYSIVDYAINACLKRIGITCREGMDEFESARLDWYRYNDNILEECAQARG